MIVIGLKRKKRIESLTFNISLLSEVQITVGSKGRKKEKDIMSRKLLFNITSLMVGALHVCPVSMNIKF